MVLLLPLISKCFSLFLQVFEGRCQRTHNNWFHHYLHVPQIFFVLWLGHLFFYITYICNSILLLILFFHSVFISLTKFRYLSLFSLSFNFILCPARTGKFSFSKVFFFVNQVGSSDWDWVICLYIQIAEKLACLILQDRFYVVHIPPIRMVKFDFFSQLPVDNLSQPFMCRLYFFCANFLHSRIILLIVSSLSPHNLHLLFCGVLSVSAFT